VKRNVGDAVWLAPGHFQNQVLNPVSPALAKADDAKVPALLVFWSFSSAVNLLGSPKEGASTLVSMVDQRLEDIVLF
jgi:hypothetical protein